jgi:hypothetical protein
MLSLLLLAAVNPPMVRASSLPKGYQKKCAGCAVYRVRNVSMTITALASSSVSADARKTPKKWYSMWQVAKIGPSLL